MSITNTESSVIKTIAKAQREYFANGATLEYKFRKEQLKKLQKPTTISKTTTTQNLPRLKQLKTISPLLMQNLQMLRTL